MRRRLSSSSTSSAPVEEPMKTFTPAQPGARSSSGKSSTFSRVPPMKNARSQCMRCRPRFILSAKFCALTVSGSVFGISNTAVTPPMTALRDPVSRSSLWVWPGSRKCTWVSITPGRMCRPLQSTISAAPAEPSAPMAAMRPPEMPISRTPSPSWLTTVPAFRIVSNMLVIACLQAGRSPCDPHCSGLRCAVTSGVGVSPEKFMKAAFLPDRGVVKVNGEDAGNFLNGLVTTDTGLVRPGLARFGALLTPQGKITVDFLITEAPAGHGGGFLLDCPRALAQMLADKLGFYKLRAKVAVENLSDSLGVLAAWGGEPAIKPDLSFADPRSEKLGWRILVPEALAPKVAQLIGAELVDSGVYEAHRIASGV